MEFSTTSVFLALLAIIAIVLMSAAMATTTGGKRVLMTLRFTTSSASITMTPVESTSDEFVDLELGLCAPGLMNCESKCNGSDVFAFAQELKQDASFGAATVVMGLCSLVAIAIRNDCGDTTRDDTDSFVIIIAAEDEDAKKTDDIAKDSDSKAADSEEEAHVVAHVTAEADSEEVRVKDGKTALVEDDDEAAELVNLDAAETKESDDEVDDGEQPLVEETDNATKNVAPTDAKLGEAVQTDLVVKNDEKTRAGEDECGISGCKLEDAGMTDDSNQQQNSAAETSAVQSEIEIATESVVEVQDKKRVKTDETNIARSLDQFDWNGNMHFILEDDSDDEDEPDDDDNDDEESGDEAPIFHEVLQAEQSNKSLTTLEEISLDIPSFVNPEDVLDRPDCYVLQ